MEVDHRRIGKRITGHPHIQHRRGFLTRDSINTSKGADRQVEPMVGGEARTQSDLRTASIRVVTLTITPKIAPSIWSQRENGSRLCESLATIYTKRSKPHHAMESPSSAILSISSFAFSITSLPNKPSSTSVSKKLCVDSQSRRAMRQTPWTMISNCIMRAVQGCMPVSTCKEIVVSCNSSNGVSASSLPKTSVTKSYL
jgi:hypothetical protein